MTVRELIKMLRSMPQDQEATVAVQIDEEVEYMEITGVEDRREVAGIDGLPVTLYIKPIRITVSAGL